MGALTAGGVPVPWVALWSGEETAGQLAGRLTTTGLIAVDRRTGAEYPAFQAFGTIWMPYHNAPGTGRPLFGHVHALRHLKAMRGPRCQVCGERLPKGATPWLMTGSPYDLPMDNGAIVTNTAPTCRPCMQVAVERCPHLAALPEHRALLVRSYRPIALEGDLNLPGQQVRGQVLALSDRRIPWLLAKQLVVSLEDHEPLEVAS